MIGRLRQFDRCMKFSRPQVSAMRYGLNKSNLTKKLGGFHLLMSFMGAVGKIMAGSGIEELWKQIYASASVTHMLTGHSYARALRAHFLTQLALIMLLLSQVKTYSTNDIAEVNKLHSEFLNGAVSIDDVANSDVLETLKCTLEDTCNELAVNNRTASLWLQYIRQVSIIRLFIRAERTADWELHLHCVRLMLPYLHAAGHLNYAKCAHLYYQEMKELRSKIPAEEYNNFATQGYFSIRRSDQVWSGTWSDMIIEQELMRAIKTSGGLTRGRGITESTLSQWILSLPGTLSMCNTVETISGITSVSSEQHVEMRESRQSRDKRDVQKLVGWLSDHSPFDQKSSLLVSLATGVVADESVNCDSAEAIGKACISKIVGGNFGNLKLKRSEAVKPMSYFGSNAKGREDFVPIDTNQLFMRIACVMKTEKDFQNYLKYELAPRPPSLFCETVMRKTDKSVLAALLPSSIPTNEELATLLSYKHSIVVDGGMLLRKVIWPRPATYDQVFQAYVRYVVTHYSTSSTILFDGYSTITTKQQEQIRRIGKRSCADVMVEGNKMVTSSQADFLSNSGNKTKLIEQLTPYLQSVGVCVKNAKGDADSLIVSTAMDSSNCRQKVTVVASDTDILVMLAARASSEAKITLLIPNIGSLAVKMYSIPDVQRKIGEMKNHILFVHAMTGCDTTSALYSKGKKKAWTMLSANKGLQKVVSIFTKTDPNRDEIAEAGEKFLKNLYNGGNCTSLDELRVLTYGKNIARVYLQVQQWLGNDLDPTQWGWKIHNGIFMPKPTLQPPAPDELLCIITCNCKGDCASSIRCACKKAGLECTIMCGRCLECCNNITITDLDEGNDANV